VTDRVRLDVSRRNEAINRAVELGLVRPTLGMAPALEPSSAEGPDRWLSLRGRSA